MKEAFLYKKLPGNTVQCGVCHHQCKIAVNRRGICSVRQNKNGKLYALNYGKSISESVDPVEKKPLFHFLPGTFCLSFATLGCNFRCDNCQNWQISQGSKNNSEIIGDNLLPDDIIKHALFHKCSSIAYTYTEPTIFLEYAFDTMVMAKNSGLKNIWVSNGYMSKEAADLIIPYLDAINIDLKFFDDNLYRKYCGGSLKPVIDNIRYFKEAGVWVEVTTLIIPKLNDDAEALKKMSKFLSDKVGNETPWHLSCFSPNISYKMKKHQATSLDTLEKAHAIGRSAGLRYVYLGNMPGHDFENTYCPECNELVIKRVGFRILRKDINGACRRCHKKIPLLTSDN